MDGETIRGEIKTDAEKELELTRQLGNLQEELRLMRDPDSNVKRKKKRTDEVVEKEIKDCEAQIEKTQSINKNGWILIDFPTNFAQAMLLEKALSGYQMPEDLEPT